MNAATAYVTLNCIFDYMWRYCNSLYSKAVQAIHDRDIAWYGRRERLPQKYQNPYRTTINGFFMFQMQMTERGAWLGAIYIKEEGGYQVILKSLGHYKNRLKTIGKSPELSDSAAMFASILHQQAAKSIPDIDAAVTRICNGLADDCDSDDCKKHEADADQKSQHCITMVSEDIPIIQKALACYKSDISKAQDTKHEYFVNLIGDIESAARDLKDVETAHEKIALFEQ